MKNRFLKPVFKRLAKHPGSYAILGVFLATAAVLAETSIPSLLPPGATVSPVPMPSGLPARLSPSETKTLAKEFSRAQSAEYDALKHRQKLEMQELLASQSAHYKEWNEKERGLRRDFLKAHQGAENRAYVKDFIARREALMKIQKDEKTQRAREQDIHLKSLKEDQAAKLKEFREYLGRSERPPARLWPESN